MATILLIETATQVCSAALAKDGKTIAVKELMANNIHASSLTLFIKEVMQTAETGFNQLDAIAVSKGPGSYTGLRIGVSTAKGLCYALDKPLIGINTLEMMANGFKIRNQGYNGLICSMIDARRMEVFTALYDQDLNAIGTTSAKIIEAASFEKELADNFITFIGDGAAKCAPLLDHQHAIFSADQFNSAVNMSGLAEKAYQDGHFEDVAYLEPFYLKDFVFTTPKKK